MHKSEPIRRLCAAVVWGCLEATIWPGGYDSGNAIQTKTCNNILPRPKRNPGGLACLQRRLHRDRSGVFADRIPRPPEQRPEGQVTALLERRQVERLFSRERMSTYLARCEGNFDAAVHLYRWNAAITAAFWEPIGHLEVALRNRLSAQLFARHRRLARELTWLDDPGRDLSGKGRDDIAAARARVRRKGKLASEGQTISELSFGFWRFLVAKKRTSLWPDLASAFPFAPDRRRETIEAPIARLHDFRNRLAHHQRIWNCSPVARYEDLMVVAGYIDADLPAWIDGNSSVPNLLHHDRPASTVVPIRCDELVDRYSGSLATRRDRRKRVRLLHKEWS